MLTIASSGTICVYIMSVMYKKHPMINAALRQKEEETKEIEEKMRQAAEEARKVEEERKKAEEERKKFEAEKAENEAAVSIGIFLF